MPVSIISKARVLIVDDEASNVRLLERILEMAGCGAVRSTTDSRQVLPLFFEFEPDLILLDLHMPYLDGFAVMEQLKSAAPGDDFLPILILTADITLETKRRALASGAKDLVTKPLDHSEVVLRIKNLLENRFLHRALQAQNGLLEEQVRQRTAELEETLEVLRSTQEQVVRQERLSALGMMASGIAHDFNNALTMVLGYSELLLPYMQESAPAKERAFLHHVISAAQDATHVVARLREFYRPVSGNEIRVALNLNEIVEQAVALTSPKWSARCLADGVQIEMLTELGEAPAVSGNAAELREVLTNLIFNAVDAMPEGGAITLSTRARGSEVWISVTDTGMGMTEEERERCLEPFFTTKGERGTGLGLAVVYGIIHRHDGQIEIVSEKGRGTTFMIRLPQSTHTATETVVAVEQVDRALRILVVDDQEIICELIAEYLQTDGHETAMAANGREALEQLALRPADLVITDQSMPEMNGGQLAAAMQARMPGVPVILLTGFGEEMQALDQLPPGVDLVLGKPVSAADLRRAIFTVMSQRGEVELELGEVAAMAC